MPKPKTLLEQLVYRSNLLLQQLISAGGGGSGSTPTARTPSISNATTAGSTTDGVNSVSLLVQSDNATIDGVAVPYGYAVSYDSDNSDTINSISYDPGAGSILISELS